MQLTLLASALSEAREPHTVQQCNCACHWLQLWCCSQLRHTSAQQATVLYCKLDVSAALLCCCAGKTLCKNVCKDLTSDKVLQQREACVRVCVGVGEGRLCLQ